MRHAAVLLLMFVGPAGVGATTLSPFTFDDLCARAETIYHARCTGSYSAWDTERRTIFTLTRIRVLDPLKGSASAGVTLRLPGGTVNDTTLTLPGFPVFRGDEEMVIFLTGNDRSGYPWPVGMGQGVYPVVRDASGLPKVAVQPGLNPSPLAKPASGAARPGESIPLADFLRLVRDRVRPSAPQGLNDRAQ